MARVIVAALCTFLAHGVTQAGQSEQPFEKLMGPYRLWIAAEMCRIEVGPILRRDWKSQIRKLEFGLSPAVTQKAWAKAATELQKDGQPDCDKFEFLIFTLNYGAEKSDAIKRVPEKPDF